MGRCLIINGKTLVYGIIGHPVEHSLSPAMHNAAMEEMGLNSVYVPFCPPPDRLEEAVAGIRALGMAGVNVTVPYKEAVLPYLDELTGEAGLYGAVNTIINRAGKLVGHNTDGPGFIKALRQDHQFDPAQGPALVFGAGGSARAVVAALLGAGCPEVAVVNRSVDRAAELAEIVRQITSSDIKVFRWDSADQELACFARRAALLVNCTPLGMSGAGAHFPPVGAWFHAGQLAYDLVYNPARTPFMDLASSSGAGAANGLSMLLYQGVLSLEAWTGLTAPVDTMRRVLFKQVGG